jgi:hypothetical protein
VRFYFKYLRYVIRHKYFVFVAGRKTGAPLWQLIIHDWSKFLPSEFIPYARKFHGPTPNFGWLRARFHGRPNDEQNLKDWKAQLDLAFNVAWLKHQHRNPHHWQHWLLAEDTRSKRLEVPQTSGSPRAFALPIPERYIREMVADWMGAGRAITGRWEVREWYEKNRVNLVLEQQTQWRVEELLGIRIRISGMPVFTDRRLPPDTVIMVGNSKVLERFRLRDKEDCPETFQIPENDVNAGLLLRCGGDLGHRGDHLDPATGFAWANRGTHTLVQDRAAQEQST